MEVKANEAFDIYRELYYEGGVSSVYLWNLDDGFAGVVLLKKCESCPRVVEEDDLVERGRLSLISSSYPENPCLSLPI